MSTRPDYPPKYSNHTIPVEDNMYDQCVMVRWQDITTKQHEDYFMTRAYAESMGYNTSMTYIHIVDDNPRLAVVRFLAHLPLLEVTIRLMAHNRPYQYPLDNDRPYSLR